MSLLRLTSTILVMLLALGAKAQSMRTVNGRVYTKAGKSKKMGLEGATVGALGGAAGTQTDKDGNFSLAIPDSVHRLIVSYVGYKTDTVTVTSGKSDIQLQPDNMLKDVVIRDKTKTTEIKMNDPIKVENIGNRELMKAACCNLGESLETTPSVDVAFTDAVTGYKQIKMLGLAGPYSLITRENIPDIRGLAAITGLTYTPGTWIESMQLSKGTGSVVNGYESVAGQLNVELRKPFSGDRWLFNLYQSSQGRSEANVNFRQKLNDELGTNLLVHYNTQWLKVDQNSDHFIDQPLGNQVDVLNRWIYNGKNGWMVQAGIKLVYAKAIGGEWSYKEGAPQVPGNPWGYRSTTKRLEDWAKIARVFTRPGTSVGLQLSNINHDQDAGFGPRTYTGKQTSFYANLIFQTFIGNTSNIVKAGASELIDNYDEQFAGINYKRTEQVPGIFAEYTYIHGDKFTAVAGLRADNNSLYGAFITPRLHLRYAPSKNAAFRASIGRAQRTANIFAENMGFMAGNRQFSILSHNQDKAYGLDPEVAWNTGANATFKFRIGLREAVLSMDYYYTWFQSQVVVDMEYPNIISFYNLHGSSFAHGFQAQIDYELIHNLDLRAAYRYYNIMTTYSESGTGASELKEKPLTPPHRAFLNVAYKTRSNWKFDYTIQWISSQRTPGITHNHKGLSQGGINESPSYLQMGAQITKVFSDAFEVYLGGENLTNYMQHDAIVGASDPFGNNFDASMIWGPMMGRNIYAGFRYKIR